MPRLYFFGLTVLYVTFALTIPLFETWFYEPAIYGPAAIILLVSARRRSITQPNEHGAADDFRQAVTTRPKRAIVLASLAAAMAIGASVAYGRELLNEATAGCTRDYCSTELTIVILVVMAVASVAASGMVMASVLRQGDVAMLTVTVMTAFACLALLAAPMVVFRLVPHYYYVPGLFYGLSALALLISVSTNPELADVQQPTSELRPPPDMPI